MFYFRHLSYGSITFCVNFKSTRPLNKPIESFPFIIVFNSVYLYTYQFTKDQDYQNEKFEKQKPLYQVMSETWIQ